MNPQNSLSKRSIAFLDTPSGISGDMFLGCLIDAGWPLVDLIALIEKLDLPSDEWSISAKEVMRGPLRATLVDVQTSQGHHHRRLGDIVQIIQRARFSAPIETQAIAVFTRLAQAEANVHGTAIDEVHFHEVGALDAIIDVVGVVAGINALGIEALYASGLPLGEGWTRSAHGPIPLPAPATLLLLAEVGAPTRTVPGPGELVTPTGAALLAELATFAQPPMQLRRIGHGAGQKQFDWPNIARLWLGELAGTSREETHVELSTNIDDMSPELYDPVCNNLFAAGASDVWVTPIQMKKGRPGVLLTVLAPTELEDRLATMLLEETTTLGVRAFRVRRHIAEREMQIVETAYGSIPVKIKRVNGIVRGAKPEYEACRRLAHEKHLPVRVIYDAAAAAAHARWIIHGSSAILGS